MKPAQNISDSADALCRQMDTIRASMGSDMDGLKSNAQRLVDWRHYVRAFPWMSLGVAATLGFIVVPRKTGVAGVTPDEQTLRMLAEDNGLVVEGRPRAKQKRGLLVSMAGLAGNMLLRAGIAYAGQQMGKVFGEQAATHHTPEEVYSP